MLPGLRHALRRGFNVNKTSNLAEKHAKTSLKAIDNEHSLLKRALAARKIEREKLGVQEAFQRQLSDWLSLWSLEGDDDTSQRRQGLAEKKVYERDVNEQGEAAGTGRRKEASAHIIIKEGDGLNLLIRREGEKSYRLMSSYFDRFQLNHAIGPLKIVQKVGQFDIRATVDGGGLMGQAGAVALGLARALQAWEPSYRPMLKQAGLLSRDARVVERKKPGQKKARKKFQWVKR